MRLRNIPRADGVIKSHPMVVQDTQKSRGNWKNIFGNDRPVYLEIGMGKGRFLMNMAKEHPLVNFVGIERYSSVLLRALEKYDTEEYKDLQNIRFLCMDATEIENVFNQGEIRQIYLNFSDPWPKARHARRRLTSGTFLDRYARSCLREEIWNLRRTIRSCFASLWKRFGRKKDGVWINIPMTCIATTR